MPNLGVPATVVEVADSRFEELAASLSGRVRVAKLNLDRNPQSAARLRIQGVPTLIVFRGGHEVGRMVGARGKSELMRALADVD